MESSFDKQVRLRKMVSQHALSQYLLQYRLHSFRTMLSCTKR